MIRSHKRIGPHNYDILCFIFGAVLSDAYAERHGNGTRIVLQQESSNMEFLTWYNNFLSIRGYTNCKEPAILSRIGPNNRRRFYSRSCTFTYTSFNWIHDCFYSAYAPGTKIVPPCINNYFSPLT
jgi:hypothetical protein